MPTRSINKILLMTKPISEEVSYRAVETADMPSRIGTMPIYDGQNLLGYIPILEHKWIVAPANTAPGIDNFEEGINSIQIVIDPVPHVDGYQYRIGSGDPVDIGSRKTFTITGLDEQTEYTISVRGYNSAGFTNYSAGTPITTLEDAVPDVFVIDDDTSFATYSVLDLVYVGDSPFSLLEYRIGTVTEVYGPIIETNISNDDPLQFTITGLDPDEDYFIQVRGTNGNNIGPWSEEYELNTFPIPGTFTFDTTTPAATTALVELIYGGDTDPFDSIEYRFATEIEENVFDYGDPIDTGWTDGNLEFTISELTPETEYFIQVRAVLGTDAGEWSVIEDFTTTSV